MNDVAGAPDVVDGSAVELEIERAGIDARAVVRDRDGHAQRLPVPEHGARLRLRCPDCRRRRVGHGEVRAAVAAVAGGVDQRPRQRVRAVGQGDSGMRRGPSARELERERRRRRSGWRPTRRRSWHRRRRAPPQVAHRWRRRPGATRRATGGVRSMRTVNGSVADLPPLAIDTAHQRPRARRRPGLQPTGTSPAGRSRSRAGTASRSVARSSARTRRRSRSRRRPRRTRCRRSRRRRRRRPDARRRRAGLPPSTQPKPGGVESCTVTSSRTSVT